MKEATFDRSDGLKIFYREWPAEALARGVVVINHGVNSHSGQHAWTAGRLASAGYATYAIDMRGRGRSEGPRFSIDDVQEHVVDLHQLIGLAKAAHPDLPLFLLGHSAGGVVGTIYCLDHQAELAGFVCESFAFQVPAPGLLLGLIRLLNHLAPGLPVLKLKMKDFTRDPAAVAALEADPLTKGETQPVRTVAALLHAGDRMTREFPNITIPLLILHGTADHATKFQGSQLFFGVAGSSDKTLKLYEGHYHDLLNDIGKEQVLADILSWIEARSA